MIEKNNDLEKLYQAKCRDKKIYITDVAISKIPFNEVAITCDLGNPDPLHNFGVALGSEHDVDVLSDTLSNHLIVSEKSVAVVLLHNHPSTQTFSLQDIQFFIQHPMIEVMTVVSNQGTVHYLKRDHDFDYEKVFELFGQCVSEISRKSSHTEMYMASLEFLAKCSEAGMYYR